MTKADIKKVSEQPKADFAFSFLAPVKRDEVPEKVGHRKSLISDLPFWKEINQVIEHVEKNGVSPFEQAAEIRLSDIPELKKYKNPMLTVIMRLRELLKEHQLSTKLNVIKRGDRLFLVSE